MKVSKEYIENKVKELNEWLQANKSTDPDYKQKTHNRNFYVDKLIEMDENGLEKVTI